MKKRSVLLIGIGLLLSMLQACNMGGLKPITTYSEARDHLELYGLTCKAQEYIQNLDVGTRENLVTEVTEGMSTIEIQSFVNSREVNCDFDGISDIGIVRQGAWTGEIIEQNDNGNNQTSPYLVGQDNPGAQVCGTDGNDFIGFYSKSGAYNNRSGLRLDATSVGAGCMAGDNAARVYDTNTVMICFGYWTVVFCPGDENEINNAGLWIQ